MTLEWFIILNFVFAGILLGAWLFAEWRLPQHRCPSAPIIPLYQPAAGLSPAVARWLTMRGYDRGALTASMMNLVNAQQLKIRRQGKKDFWLNVPMQAPALPQAHEERELVHMLRRITQGGAVEMALSRANQETIVDLKTRHQNSLRQTIEGGLFKPGRWAGRVFTLMLMIPLIAMLLMLFMEGFGLYAFASMGLFLLAANSIGPKHAPRLRKVILLLMLPILVWLGYITYEHLLAHDVAWDSAQAFRALVLPLTSVILITAAGFLLSIFADLSELRPTTEACELRHQAEGLKLFMSRADMDEIRQHHPDRALPQTFQRLLPYAAAFGILPLWMSLFADELARSAFSDTSGGGSGDSSSSDASGDPVGSDFSLTEFWDNLESDFDQALGDALDDASSSDSGDGGGDGGGGGGD